MDERRGDWMQTHMGVKFYALDPRPEDVCIEDIAHALALQCRFNGHTRSFYSIAEHSVRVSLVVPSHDALWGLMHDAAEAYVGDMVRPLKLFMPDFRQAEKAVMAAICERFEMDQPEPSSVKHADMALCLTEKRDLLADDPHWDAHWTTMAEPLPERIVPWSWQAAESAFLDRFNALNGRAR